MSFADDLRQAQAKLLKKQREEAERAKTQRRRVTSSSTSSGAKSSSMTVRSEWPKENDIIAFYLQKSESSKFLIENYSTKRNVSPRTMKTRMEKFALLMKNASQDMETQIKEVYNQYQDVRVGDLQKMVIDILRGEGHHIAAESATPVKTLRRDE